MGIATELAALENETFEIVDLHATASDFAALASDWCSSSCSTSSCCSCSTSSTCSCSTSCFSPENAVIG